MILPCGFEVRIGEDAIIPRGSRPVVELIVSGPLAGGDRFELHEDVPIGREVGDCFLRMAVLAHARVGIHLGDG